MGCSDWKPLGFWGWRRSFALAVLAWACATGTPAAAFRNLEKGGSAPDFALKSTTGSEVSLSGLRGRAVILVFAKQGQEKSAQALTALNALDASVTEKVARTAIVVNPNEGDATRWASEAGAKFPVLLDPGGQVYGLYGVLVTPTTGVFDPEGRFFGEVSGYTASYRTEVESLAKQALGLEQAEQKKGVSASEGAPKTEQRKSAERFLEQARILIKRKMKDKALGAAKDSVAADETYSEAHEVLGTVLLDISEGNVDEANTQYSRALELAPRNSDAKLGVARVKSIKGDYQGATTILEEAVRLNPKPEKVYYELGLVHERAKQYEKAVEAYRKALEKLLN